MKKFNRRRWLKTTGASVFALANSGVFSGLKAADITPKHIITLSFDDGFKKSSVLTAEIFEKYKLSACINVIATGSRKKF